MWQNLIIVIADEVSAMIDHAMKEIPAAALLYYGFPQVSISLRPSAKACCGKTLIFRCKTSAFTPTPS